MEGANVIDLASVQSLVKTLATVYSVAAVGYIVTRLALPKKAQKQTYTLSDPNGHKIRVTLDEDAPADERARVMEETIRTLARQAKT
jgi:hypothetical protein